MSRLVRFWRAQEGAAVAEFAMLLPVFLLLISGLYDGARLIYGALQVHAAAQAGASWARKNGWDLQGVTDAVAASSSIAVSATPAPQLAVGCLSGKAIVGANAQGQCPGGQPAGGYVLVTAQAPFSPQAPWPAAFWPAVIRAQATVRVQ
jgi:hypothetical protein